MPFPVLYASVQLKRLNKGFYQFEIRSEKKLLFCWLYLYQPDWRPVREILSVSPSASQGNQCLLSHFLASLGAQEKTNCTSMLWSIDSCQNRVSADQHHLTVPRGRVFLKLSADKLPVSNNRRLKFIFSNDSYEICCVYVTMAPHCQDFDFKLTSDAKIQPLF